MEAQLSLQKSLGRTFARLALDQRFLRDYIHAWMESSPDPNVLAALRRISERAENLGDLFDRYVAEVGGHRAPRHLPFTVREYTIRATMGNLSYLDSDKSTILLEYLDPDIVYPDLGTIAEQVSQLDPAWGFALHLFIEEHRKSTRELADHQGHAGN